MNIESILDRNINDNLVLAKFKLNQVIHEMTIDLTINAIMNTFDPEIHVSSNLFTPKTSSAINIQAITSSSHASSFKKKKIKSSRSKFFKILSSMSFQFIEYFNNLFYTSDQDFDAEFREFLDAIAATSTESLSEIQIITKRNDFHRMNQLLKTFLINIERSKFN